MNYLVTGALGFIGSNFVNYYSEKYPNIKITVLDKNNYCSSMLNIISSDVKVIVGDIVDKELIKNILYQNQINVIVHFAAESHVDNSFGNSLDFTINNVLGTHILLEMAKNYNDDTSNIKLFVHCSTDEVYGEVSDDEICTEQSILDPTNPYAATKASAEFIAKSYFYSYKLPVIITRSNNVYGINQYPEKIIPKFICQLLENKPLTIHGTGSSKRNFIHVYDICTAFETIINSGIIGSIYNISAAPNSEFSVLEIAKILIKLFDLGDLDVNSDLRSNSNLCIFVPDRNFNDRRYYTSSTSLEGLGWAPVKTDFEQNLQELIEWYKNNKYRYL